MVPKHQLTKEALKQRFRDSFELAQFAIDAARYLIKSGHEVDVSYLLQEIQRNPSLYSVENLTLLDQADQGNVAEESNA